MRKGLLVAGVILLVIGIALAADSQVPATLTGTAPLAPGALALQVNLVGPGSATISWSGAPAGTTVVLFNCASADCSSASSVIANGTGSSGSFSGSLSPGGHYGIHIVGSSPVSVTVSVTGITILTVIGIVLAVLGAILAVLSLRRSKAMSTSDETTPVEQAAPTDEADPPGGPSPATADGTRANLTCAHCGAVNEPWITNCRKCKRPLSSTGT